MRWDRRSRQETSEVGREGRGEGQARAQGLRRGETAPRAVAGSLGTSEAWREPFVLKKTPLDAGSWGAGYGGDVGRTDRYAGG
jgi:hypothetical protein